MASRTEVNGKIWKSMEPYFGLPEERKSSDDVVGPYRICWDSMSVLVRFAD